MKKALLFSLVLVASDALAAPAGAAYFKPGRWVEVPVTSQGDLAAPGATTVVGEERADTQYALPMSVPWTATFNGAKLDVAAIPEGAWLVAECDRGPGGRAAARDGILKALPPGSVLAKLGDIRRGVPESVDLIVCYDFSESRLQPQEQAAVEQFVRRGGAVFFLFESSVIPAASETLWRSLFGAHGKKQTEVMGLPRGLRVAEDFPVHLDVPPSERGRDLAELWRRAERGELAPDDLGALENITQSPDSVAFVWQRCGRGVVLAYRRPDDRTLEKAAGTAKLFSRAVDRIRAHRRPVTVRPVEPEVFGLFDPPEWSNQPRRRLTLLAGGYAVGAIGLLLSFGALLSKRRWTWLAGAACIGLGGVAVTCAVAGGASGLSLDTASMIIQEPGVDPVAVTFARISRLGPGRSPELRSPMMPPKLVLYSRYSAAQKNWVSYRFRPDGPTVEPLLDVGQSLCLSSVRPVFFGRRHAGPAPGPDAPPNADKLISLFKRRWASKDVDYTFRWVRLPVPPRVFAVLEEDCFVQVRRGPALVVTGTKKKPPVKPDQAPAEPSDVP